MSKDTVKSSMAFARQGKRALTWEEIVFYSIPARLLHEAKKELMERVGVSYPTFKKYLKGRYPNPIMRDFFRQALFETYKLYRDRASEEVLIELDK